MNKQQQEIMDGFINRHGGKNIFGAAYFEINGVNFTSEQFTQRASEPGWINGYKYGVEYETNGKKPDLVGQVIIEPFYRGAWQCRARVDELSWDFDNMGYDYPVTKFRIVDERYKPVDVVSKIPEKQQNVSVLSENNQKTENVSDWYDYEKQQAIALPPVGVECEMVHPGISSYGWQKVTIENYFQSLDKKNRVVVSNHNGNVWSVKHPVIKVDDELKFRPLDWDKNVDKERESFVKFATDLIYSGACCTKGEAKGGAEKLYDAGCRFTENKAAS